MNSVSHSALRRAQGKRAGTSYKQHRKGQGIFHAFFAWSASGFSPPGANVPGICYSCPMGAQSRRHKKDVRIFILSTVFFAWYLLPSIITAGLSVLFFTEPTMAATPGSFLAARVLAMGYLLSCPAALLWGCTVPWLFHVPGDERRVYRHITGVLIYTAPLVLTVTLAFLRLFIR